jgi:hypothetical protein
MIPVVTEEGVEFILGVQCDVSWLINIVCDRHGFVMNRELFDNSWKDSIDRACAGLAKLSVVWQTENPGHIQRGAGSKAVLDQYLHMLKFTEQVDDNPYRTLCDVFNDMQLGGSSDTTQNLSCADMMKKVAHVIEDNATADHCQQTPTSRCSRNASSPNKIQAMLSDPVAMASVISEDKRRREMQFQSMRNELNGIKEQATVQTGKIRRRGLLSKMDRDDSKRRWQLAIDRVIDLNI